MPRVVLITLLVGLTAYLVYAFYYFVIQRTVIYPRHLVENQLLEEMQINGLRIWLQTRQGRIESWLLPPHKLLAGRQYPVLIFAHANAELIDYWPHHVASLREMGIGVLLVEFPGYGRSQGEPAQKSISDAFVAAYDALAAREDVDKERIAVFGKGLGGGAACALAKRRKIKALILMSTFTSISSIAKSYLLPSFMVIDPFDNLSVVKDFAGKLLVVHGKQDETYPYAMAVELAKAAHDAKLIALDCGHTDCIQDWNKFWRGQEGFFRGAGVLK